MLPPEAHEFVTPVLECVLAIFFAFTHVISIISFDILFTRFNTSEFVNLSVHFTLSIFLQGALQTSPVLQHPLNFTFLILTLSHFTSRSLPVVPSARVLVYHSYAKKNYLAVLRNLNFTTFNIFVGHCKTKYILHV